MGDLEMGDGPIPVQCSGVVVGQRTLAPVSRRRLPKAVVRQLGDLRRGLTVVQCQVELDSHAEQSCVSELCALIIHRHERTCTVYGYDGGEGRVLDIVDAVLMYTDPSTGDKWMLVLNQALCVPGLQHPLLCSNQVRMNDIRVNDEPKVLVLNPTEYHHAIAIKTPDGNERVDELIIPLSLSGVFSYFEGTKPTAEQWTSAHPDWCLHLTYDAPEWEPRELSLAEDEAAMTGIDGQPVERDTDYWNQERVSRMIASLSKDRVFDTPAASLATAIQANVHMRSNVKTGVGKAVKAVTTAKKHWKVGPAALAKRWNIGIGTAKRTIDVTTQLVVRNITNPQLTRRFATNDKLLRFRRLPCRMYTDTLKAKKRSWYRGNLFGQVYATDYGWVGFYPIQSKADVHHTLTELAHEKGVPTHFAMDNAKEQIHGAFRKEARSYGCHVRELPTHSPWLDLAETGVHELKKGAARAMV